MKTFNLRFILAQLKIIVYMHRTPILYSRNMVVILMDQYDLYHKLHFRIKHLKIFKLFITVYSYRLPMIPLATMFPADALNPRYTSLVDTFAQSQTVTKITIFYFVSPSSLQHNQKMAG